MVIRLSRVDSVIVMPVLFEGRGLDATRLHADYTGIRPKLYREGEPVPDFLIHGPAVHGTRGLVSLYGIESPGLTASMAIGEVVRDMLR